MTEQELVEKACRGFLAAIDAHVYVGDRNDLEGVIIDGHVNVDACMRAAISVIREALSEPSLQAEVDRLRVALALIAHECISRRPATAVQTVKDVRAIAHRAITLSYLRLQPDG